jgi:hypothetical protein
LLPPTDRGFTWSGVSRTSPSPQRKHIAVLLAKRLELLPSETTLGV